MDPCPTPPSNPAAPGRRPRIQPLAALGALLAVVVGCREGESPTGVLPGATAPVFSYPSPPEVLLVGAPLAPLTPEVDGAVTGFSVVPDLPPGLQLDPTTGVLSGAALDPFPPTAFAVTATGPGGSDSVDLSLEARLSFDAPRGLYALSFEPPRLVHWRVDASTGSLVAGLSEPTLPQPYRLAADPAGRFLFSVHLNGALVSYRVDPESGATSSVAMRQFAGALVDAEVSPNGRFLYAASLGEGRIHVLAIDPTSGALAPAGPPYPAPGVTDIALSADGSRLFGAGAGSNLLGSLAIDPATGAIASLLDLLDLQAPFRLALSPDEGLFVVAQFALSRLRTVFVDAATGELSLGPERSAPKGPIDLAFEQDGERLWVAGQGSKSLAAFAVLGASGQLGAPQLVEVNGRAVAVVPGPLGDGDWLAPDFDGARLVRTADPMVGGGAVLGLAGGLAAGPLPVHAVLLRGPKGDRLVPGPLHVAQFGSGLLATVEPAGLWEQGWQETSAVQSGNGPGAVAIDGGGTWLAVTSQQSAELRLFPSSAGKPVGNGALAPLGFLPRDVVLTRDGRIAAVVSASGVETFLRSGTGLVPVDEGPTGESPAALVRSADERFVYTANRGSGSLSVFALSPDGTISEVVGSPISVGANSEPRALAVSPDGRNLYVALSALNQVRAFALDPVSGLPVLQGSWFSNPSPRALDVSPDGRYLASADTDLNRLSIYRRDANGDLAALASTPAGIAPRSVAFDPTGRYLAVSAFFSDSVELFAFDPITGQTTGLGNLPQGAGSRPVDAVFAPRWAEFTP